MVLLLLVVAVVDQVDSQSMDHHYLLLAVKVDTAQGMLLLVEP